MHYDLEIQSDLLIKKIKLVTEATSNAVEQVNLNLWTKKHPLDIFREGVLVVVYFMVNA